MFKTITCLLCKEDFVGCSHRELCRSCDKSQDTITKTMILDVIPQVAAGLRRMTKKPDAFLYCDENDFIWDKCRILGIPVFRTNLITNIFTDEEVPFIPLWTENGDYICNIKQFIDGYTEITPG